MTHSPILSFYKFKANLLKTDHPKKQDKLVEQIKYQMYVIIYRHLTTFTKLRDISIWYHSVAQK